MLNCSLKKSIVSVVFATVSFFPGIGQNCNLQVTFNYRLGAIGFMSLNLPDYAGNMGHKDQVLAMKWIDENIKQFGGGGPTTLIGHDTGIIRIPILIFKKP